jgi:hypothetical protein
MKYFSIDENKAGQVIEVLNERGNRIEISDIQYEESPHYNADFRYEDIIKIKQVVDFSRFAVNEAITIFEDGSIFDYKEGVFSPVRIVAQEVER